MFDKIILNITHSDDYTDYLFVTAGLTNKRIVPLIQPSEEAIKEQSDCNTLVLRCFNSRRKIDDLNMAVEGDERARSIRVFSRAYLDDDGTIHHGQAEMVRAKIDFILSHILFSPNNIRPVFRHYFPLFWMKRDIILNDPRYFFCLVRYAEYWDRNPLTLGAILKATEDNPRTFRIQLGGGCSCNEKPILVDAEQMYGEHWTIYTWCPVCHTRRDVRAWHFQRDQLYERDVLDIFRQNDKGQGLSALSLFDVIDTLTSA